MMSRKDSLKCTKCKVEKEELWTLGFDYMKYLKEDSWFCEECLEREQIRIDKILKKLYNK